MSKKKPDEVPVEQDTFQTEAERLLHEEGFIAHDRFDARRISAFWSTLRRDGMEIEDVLAVLEIWWGGVVDDDDEWAEFETIEPGEWTGDESSSSS